MSVSIVTCPDLRQAPFNLAALGRSGNPRIADVGVPLHPPTNLAPMPKLYRKYSFLEMAKLMEMGSKGALLAELMPNLSLDGETISNRTPFAKLDGNGECLCEEISTPDCGLMERLEWRTCA
jgi:hypothetical protein